MPLVFLSEHILFCPPHPAFPLFGERRRGKVKKYVPFPIVVLKAMFIKVYL